MGFVHIFVWAVPLRRFYSQRNRVLAHWHNSQILMENFVHIAYRLFPELVIYYTCRWEFGVWRKRAGTHRLTIGLERKDSTRRAIVTTRTNNRISHREAERFEGSVNPHPLYIKRWLMMTFINKETADRLKLADRLRDISRDTEDYKVLLKTLEALERRNGSR